MSCRSEAGSRVHREQGSRFCGCSKKALPLSQDPVVELLVVGMVWVVSSLRLLVILRCMGQITALLSSFVDAIFPVDLMSCLMFLCLECHHLR